MKTEKERYFQKGKEYQLNDIEADFKRNWGMSKKEVKDSLEEFKRQGILFEKRKGLYILL